ncbi:MAG TPA: hypothetical protein VF159_01425 [Gemmatimonadaceae bacterium]
MIDDKRDPVLDAVVSELRRTDAVNPAVVSRVVRAAVDARDEDWRDDLAPAPRFANRWRLAAVVLLSTAAGVAGFMLRGAAASRAQGSAAAVATAAAVPREANGPMTAVSASDLESMAVPTQFVLESRAAHRVALVGDFNGWNPSQTPMARHDGSGLWATTIPVAPGRHLYAFMIDDSLFTLDPRKPAAKDRDIGATASVIIVGRP